MKQVTIFQNNLNATVFAKSRDITPASTNTRRLGALTADKSMVDIFAGVVCSIGKKGADISKP